MNHTRFAIILCLFLNSYLVNSQISKQFLARDSALYELLNVDKDSAMLVIQDLKGLIQSKEEKSLYFNGNFSYYQSIGDHSRAAKYLDSVEHLVNSGLTSKLPNYRYWRDRGKMQGTRREIDASIQSLRKSLSYVSNQDELALSYYLIGGTYNYGNNFDSSEIYTRKAIEINDTTLIAAHGYNALGSLFYKKQSLDSVLFYLNIAAEIYAKHKKNNLELMIKSNLAILYKEFGEYEKAIKLVRETISRLDPKNPRSIRTKVSLLGLMALTDQCDSVFLMKDEVIFGLKANEKIYHLGLCVTYGHILDCYRKTGQIVRAEKIGEEMLSLAKKYNDTNQVIIAMCKYGYAIAKSKPQKASKLYQQALLLAKIIDHKSSVKDVYIKMMRLSRNNGDYKNAMLYRDTLDELEKQYKYDSLQVVISNLDSKHQADLANRDKKILDQELKLEKSLKRRMMLLLTSLCLGLALVLVLVVNWFRRRKAKLEKFNQSLESDLKGFRKLIINKNKVINQLENEVLLAQQPNLSNNILDELKLENDWISFLDLFEKRYPELNTFLKKFELTKTDFRICAMAALDVSNHEIGDLLNITLAGVKKAKNRVRKKLALDPKTRLTEFLRSNS